MNFDFDQISVPFRMRPGLRRLEEGTPQLTRLNPASSLFAEKRLVREANQSRHCVPGFDAAPAIDAIAAHARAMCIADQSNMEHLLELAYEEDFAVLDGATGTVPWLCVCVPSHWAPEEKLGLDFMALHRPVADNAVLLAASQQLMRLVTAGGCWERFVWTLSPSPRFDQHPRRHRRAAWPATGDAQAVADQCFFRAERQTFFPVGRGTRQAVFTIRVMLEPLTQVVDSPQKARLLRDSLASMSAAVLDYKELTLAREPLLQWLSSRCGATEGHTSAMQMPSE